jgi:hypothetical protein
MSVSGTYFPPNWPNRPKASGKAGKEMELFSREVLTITRYPWKKVLLC